MKAILIMCRCGRILRYKQWVWVTNSFSKMIGNIVKRNNFNGIVEIELLVEDCEFCKRKEEKNENSEKRVL